MKWTKTTEKLPPDNLWYFTRYSGGSDIFRKLHHINGKWFDEKGSPYGSLGEIEWLDESSREGVLLQTEELEDVKNLLDLEDVFEKVYAKGRGDLTALMQYEKQIIELKKKVRILLKSKL